VCKGDRAIKGEWRKVQEVQGKKKNAINPQGTCPGKCVEEL